MRYRRNVHYTIESPGFWWVPYLSRWMPSGKVDVEHACCTHRSVNTQKKALRLAQNMPAGTVICQWVRESSSGRWMDKNIWVWKGRDQ